MKLLDAKRVREYIKRTPLISANAKGAICLDLESYAIINGRDKPLSSFLRENKQNNGDKLRSMTNEELARYLWIESDRMTPEAWLDWLNAT